MAKDYIAGAKYNLYLDTEDDWNTPGWEVIKAAGDIDVATNPDDIVVPERGSSTGHLNGEDDPAFTFTLMEDAGNTHVTTLVNALASGAMVHLAIARGNMSDSGTKYWHMECLLRGVSLTASRGDVAQYAVEARRHANSDNDLTAATTSS